MIDLRLTPNSEQTAYYQQIHLLQENFCKAKSAVGETIVVHDRGYFSHILLNTLVCNSASPQFIVYSAMPGK